jgi:GH35 family endo-1,4-beta-xylanase
VAILGDDPQWALKPGAGASQIELSRVAVTNQPFDSALRVQLKSRTSQPFGIALALDTSEPFGARETLFVRFWSRRIGNEGDGGTLSFRLDNKVAERPAAFLNPPTVPITGQWRRFDFPVPTRAGMPAGGGRFALGLGLAGPGTVELAGLEVLRFADTPPQALPFVATTYEGREPDAPWRREAQARIEKYRKADLRIVVADAQGRPVPHATVRVEMTRHAYAFGTEFDPKAIVGTSPDDVRYRESLAKLFNRAVPGGSLKWPAWEQPRQRQTFLEALDWLNAHGVEVRGHVLVWPNWRYLPADARALGEPLVKHPDPAASARLADRVQNHIRDETAALRGRITDWDVVNETYHNHALMDVLGEPVMIDWYRAAREGAGPDVPLYLNENSVLTGEKTDLFLRHARLLLDGGAPLGGLGEQAHGPALPIATLAANLDRLAALGLPIQITEFDIVTPDEALQADWTRDYLTLAFSHPATVGFIMWGFWDGNHWLGDAPIYDRDWNLKPSGRAWIDLVHNQWWTRDEGPTNPSGEFRTRGFLGDYAVSVSLGDRRVNAPTRLARDGRTLTLTLPDTPAPPRP